jgi:hypothetical protein
MTLTNNKQRKRSNVLVLVEAFIIGYVSYIANVVVASATFTPQTNNVTLISIVSILTFLVLVFSLSVGLFYRLLYFVISLSSLGYWGWVAPEPSLLVQVNVQLL